MSKTRSLKSSFKYAFAGLREAVTNEPNFQIHVSVALTVVVTAALLKVSRFEWITLVFTIFFVLILELLNTTLESIVDLVQPKYHKKAKIAKDVSAAFVLLGAFVAVLVAVVIFTPRFIELFLTKYN